MMIDLYNLISFPLLIIFILTSIIGFGLSINKIFKFNILENEIKNLFFFKV